VSEQLLLAHRPKFLEKCEPINGKLTLHIQGFEILVMLNKLKVKEVQYVLPIVRKLTINVNF
jgi:hypothetical protein